MGAWSLLGVSWRLRLLSAFTGQHTGVLGHKQEAVEVGRVSCFSCDSPLAMEQVSKSIDG